MSGNGTIHRLLEGAALEGRGNADPRDLVRQDWELNGHHAQAPTLRCQECGRLLDILIAGDHVAGIVHRDPEA